METMTILMPDGSLVQKPLSYFPKAGETIVLDEVSVGDVNNDVETKGGDMTAASIASVAKKSIGFVVVGSLAYYILKVWTKAPILP